MLLWMTRITGFLIGASLGALVLAAPEAAAQWPFGKPTPLSQIEADVAEDHGDITHVSPDQIARMQAEGAPLLLLDVREKDEFEVSHIPGAVQVDPGASAADIKALLAGTNPETPVIVYCSVGRRSSNLGSRVVDSLEGRQVANLSGGIFAWHNASLPLEDAVGQTDKVHPYNRRWGQLVERKDEIAYSPAH